MNEVLSAAQWKEADATYLQVTGINSLQLMERAAVACTAWLHAQWKSVKHVVILAGHGNNGGDGLAICRLLLQKGYQVQVYRVASASYAADNQANADLLDAKVWIDKEQLGEALQSCDAIIDTLLGIGTTRKTTDEYAHCIELVNTFRQKTIYSIDLPSGMPAELPFDEQWPVVKATHTLCLEGWKLNLLLPQGGSKAGEIHLIPLGLSEVYEPRNPIAKISSTATLAQLLPERNRFAHKGQFGHALLIAGSQGMWGAGLLAAEACLRSGAGKTTIAGPQEMCMPLTSKLPEAMYLHSGIDCWTNDLAVKPYTAIGIGPGIGKSTPTRKAFRNLLTSYRGPLVLDADALNILADAPDLLEQLQPNTIFTPHMGEFDRLFGQHNNWWSRLETAQRLTKQKGWVIVLKNAYTLIFSEHLPFPLVNTTGNPGLAKGGSGDVLTGIITGLLAQGLAAPHAAALGVYLHGLSADLAKAEQHEISMLASDVVKQLAKAISSLTQTSTS